MDIDFSSLASRIGADIEGLRGCIIVSRDGLVLGGYPAEGEKLLRPAWLRFAALGDVERGFIEFSGDLWVYVHRGPYAAFAVSAPTGRPGLLIDELEQVLLSAEEARSKRTAGNRPAEPAADAPRSKPRTSLHPEARPAAAPEPVAAPAAQQTQVQESPAPAAAPAPAFDGKSAEPSGYKGQSFLKSHHMQLAPGFGR
jgi:hypothetical protein